MSSTALDSAFFKDIFGTDEMRGIFQEQNQLQKWLDVEAALARVEARLGIIPQEAADVIVRHCRAEEMSIEAIKKGMDVTRHPIVPVMLGDERKAMEMAAEMNRRGIFVVGFTYPVVPRGQARIRVQLSAAHTDEQIDRAVNTFREVGRSLEIIG